MQPFQKRSVLFVDTMFDQMGVVEHVLELGLRPYVVHSVAEVADKMMCPHIDEIVVDSLHFVCICFRLDHLSGTNVHRCRRRACGGMSIYGIYPLFSCVAST